MSFDYLITFLAQKLAKFTKVEVRHEKCTGSCSDFFTHNYCRIREKKKLLLESLSLCKITIFPTLFLQIISFMWGFSFLGGGASGTFFRFTLKAFLSIRMTLGTIQNDYLNVVISKGVLHPRDLQNRIFLELVMVMT